MNDTMDDSMQKAIGQYFGSMNFKAPANWEQLPDLDLYMDQVVTYLERQLEAFRKPGEEHLITPSMINNYAKAKIIPRTEGKKYAQEHIARLLSVFVLKRVLSVQDIRELFEDVDDAASTREFYELFRQSMEKSAEDTAATIATSLPGSMEGEAADESSPEPLSSDPKAVRTLALKLAVDASLRSYAAEMLLSLLAEQAVPEEKDKPKKQQKSDNRA